MLFLNGCQYYLIFSTTFFGIFDQSIPSLVQTYRSVHHWQKTPFINDPLLQISLVYSVNNAFGSYEQYGIDGVRKPTGERAKKTLQQGPIDPTL